MHALTSAFCRKWPEKDAKIADSVYTRALKTVEDGVCVDIEIASLMHNCAKFHEAPDKMAALKCLFHKKMLQM